MGNGHDIDTVLGYYHDNLYHCPIQSLIIIVYKYDILFYFLFL